MADRLTPWQARYVAATVLDVPPEADAVRVASAYRRAVAACHPSSGGDPGRLSVVTAAWQTLRATAPQPDRVIDLAGAEAVRGGCVDVRA